MAIFGHPEPTAFPAEGCSFVARVPFDYGPRQFKAGEDFHFDKLGLTIDQAIQLWSAGRLLVKSQTAPPTQTPDRSAKRKG